MTRAVQTRANILHLLAEKSADELAELALQIPMRFSATETLEERIKRLLPYIERGWVELESDHARTMSKAAIVAQPARPHRFSEDSMTTNCRHRRQRVVAQPDGSRGQWRGGQNL